MTSEGNNVLVLDTDDDEDDHNDFELQHRDEDTFAATQDLLSTSRPDSFRLHLESSQWPSLTIDDEHDNTHKEERTSCKRATDDQQEANNDQDKDDEENVWREKRPRLHTDNNDLSIIEVENDARDTDLEDDKGQKSPSDHTSDNGDKAICDVQGPLRNNEVVKDCEESKGCEVATNVDDEDELNKTDVTDTSVVIIDSSLNKGDVKEEENVLKDHFEVPRTTVGPTALESKDVTEMEKPTSERNLEEGTNQAKLAFTPSTISPVSKPMSLCSQDELKMTSTPQDEDVVLLPRSLSKTLSNHSVLKLILMEESQYNSIFVSSDLKRRCIRTYTMNDQELVSELCHKLDKSCTSTSFSSQITLDELEIKNHSSSTKKRLSEASRATTSSSSGGYNGDVESTVTSGSSECNTKKRDRLSINPDTEIKCPRRPKVAPLPSSARTVNLESIDESDDTSTTIQTTTTLTTKKPKDSTIVPGSMVFAIYAQPCRSCYWPARVLRCVDHHEKKDKSQRDEADGEKEDDDEETRLPHFEIEYIEDSIVSTLPLSSLIPAASLIAGHEVTVPLKSDKGHTVKASIRHVIVNADNCIEYSLSFNPSQMSLVARNADTQVVNFEDTLINEQQCKTIRQHLGGPWLRDSKPLIVGADIDLNNVIGSSRRTKKSNSFTPLKESGRKLRVNENSSRKSTRTKKGGCFVETSENDAEQQDQATPKSSRKGRGDVEGVTGHGRHQRSRQKLFSSNSKKKRGTQSARQSDLFIGLSFLITQAKEGHRSDNPDEDEKMTRLEDESEDDENDAHYDCLSFNKDELSFLIESNGGTVLSSLPSLTPLSPSSTYVVSNRHCRTLTYLVGLAYNIPRISFEWIYHSVEKKELKPIRDYLLPNGVYDMELVEPKMVNDNIISTSTNLLKDRPILLLSTNEDFLSPWEQLVSRMGASVYKRSKGGIDCDVGSIKMVIVDLDGAPIKALEDAKKRDIDVVNTKWVIESLITGKLRPTQQYCIGNAI